MRDRAKDTGQHKKPNNQTRPALPDRRYIPFHESAFHLNPLAEIYLFLKGFARV